jgi:ABC-type hemin transport system ATPase subunit
MRSMIAAFNFSFRAASSAVGRRESSTVRLGPASLTISVLSTGAADFVSSMHGGPSLASSLFLRRARLGLRAMRAVRNVGSPSVVLADEPTAALDSENGHAVMTVLAEIAKDPARALFIVTHDPRIIPFADRILRIEDGRIVSDQQRSEHAGAVHTLKYAS